METIVNQIKEYPLTFTFIGFFLLGSLGGIAIGIAKFH